MKPTKTFLFLLCILAVVLPMYFSLHDEPESTTRLQTPLVETRERIRPERQREKTEKKDKAEKEAPSLSSLPLQWEKDSLMRLYKKLYRLDADIFEDELLGDVPLTSFEYDSAGAGRYLLQDFFAKLLALRHPLHAGLLASWYEKPDFWNEDLPGKRASFVRVLHYGGSLVENDYVTGTLRRLMQEDFGGRGVGLLPLFQPGSTRVPLKRSGKWHVSRPKKNALGGNFGVYTACLAPPPINALTPKTSDKGFIQIGIPEEYRRQGLFLECILHEDVSGNQLQVDADARKLSAIRTVELPGQQRRTYALPPQTKQADLTLTLSKNAILYALSLNDTVGVCVDNLAFKDNEGTVFSPNNRRFLINQLHLLNTGLIIYQFDGSAALGKNKDYGYYKMSLMKELGHIRMLMPQTPVIVVGTASSGHIDRILDIQRECAFACGCVFWNLDRALGGDNAMARWAEAQPALVSRNLSHFTPMGADWAGKLFYRAFLHDYRRFLLQEKKNMMLQRARQLLPASQKSQS